MARADSGHCRTLPYVPDVCMGVAVSICGGCGQCSFSTYGAADAEHVCNVLLWNTSEMCACIPYRLL